jgi:hypothetical protein
VNFNLYSYHPITEIVIPKNLYGGRLVTSLKSKTWVILDKINTQNIKTFKTTEGLKLTNNKKGIILTDSQSTRTKKVTIPLEDVHLLQNKDLIDRFSLYKLKMFS